MNEGAYEAAATAVHKTYVQQGKDARRTHEKHIQVLLQQHKLPDEGWSDLRIQLLLQELSLMDSNNFPENVGVGEREARVVSDLVAQRHYRPLQSLPSAFNTKKWSTASDEKLEGETGNEARLGHGIGRSGDITAIQPKAAGSSLIAKLTNSMIVDLLRHAGVYAAKRCVLIPVATGMAMLLVLLTLKQKRPEAKYVLWPRIDQKSCFKCMVSAGLVPVVIENILEGDELRTDVHAVEGHIQRLGAENVVCVLTTTSCFAPRALDRVPEVGQICKTYQVPHIVNNAYGVQSTKCMHFIQEAHRVGRVDAFVQSTDKNFMVPVGGAVVASSSETFIQDVAQIYPGRASGTPSLDVFITLLSLGEKGYRQLCISRKDNYKYLKEKLAGVAARHGERVLSTPNNPISVGVTLSSLSADKVNWTEFGSMLFIKNVSGTRVVAPGSEKVIGPHTFQNWGAHHNGYPCAYFTAAAAIGMRKEEVDTFASRLDKVFIKFKKKYSPSVELKSDCPPDVSETNASAEANSLKEHTGSESGSQRTQPTQLEGVAHTESESCIQETNQ